MKLTVDLELTPAQLAFAFSEMSDEQQAQFFIDVALLVRAWPDPIARQLQAMEIGKHLAECSCSNEDARTFVRDIVEGMESYREAAQ